MGTSSSYKGSTSKNARGLRDGLSDWSKDSGADGQTPLPESVLSKALFIPKFTRGAGGGGGPSGGSGGGGSSRSGQSSPQRSARAYAATAGRAAGAARAFREGNAEALQREGLDFEKLSALPSRAEMVRAILDAVCEAQDASDIPNEEQREIALHLIDWMLDTDINPSVPSTAEIAEHSIGLIVAEVFLSETNEFTPPGKTREQFVEQVYDVSQNLASRADLSSKTAASQRTIEEAIEKGLKFLRRLYPKDQS